MYKLNGKTLRVGRAFTVGDTQYPANWLQLSTEADRNALGIIWEDDPVRADDRYYWNGDVNNPKALDDVNEVDEDNNPIYVQEWNPDTEQMEDTDEQLVTRGLKYNMKQQVQQTAGSLLAQTDWYVTRNSEKSTAIPADVTTKRDAIRTECDRLETAIDGATTVEALITVMNSQNWPE
jgi:hypothetical protein